MTRETTRKFIVSPIQYIVGILLVVFVGFQYQLSGDFSIYMAASEQLALGKDIYSMYFNGDQRLPYMASPALAYLFYPLSTLPLGVAAAIWKTLNILLIIRLWVLFEKYFVAVNWIEKQNRNWVLLSVLSLSFILYRNFHLSQFSVVLLYLIFEGVHQIRTGKYLLLGPLLLGLGITIKILPIVAIPYLLFRGFWKEVLLVFAFLGLIYSCHPLALG